MRGLEATFEPGVGARTLDRNNTVYGDLNMKERRSFKACGGASLRGKLRERERASDGDCVRETATMRGIVGGGRRRLEEPLQRASFISGPSLPVVSLRTLEPVSRTKEMSGFCLFVCY